ncbi:MAG: transposase [Atribacterota bacterium]|nr:transposase [Atribacterota bacterium]
MISVIFKKILCKVTKCYHLILHSYCLMHNHYHLLLETPEGNLSQGIRQLNGTHTQQFNKKYQRVGHLLQGRFKSILVEKENYLLELSRYIVLNPLRVNLVEDLRDWHYSSYPQTIGVAKKIPCLFPDWILSQFGPDKKSARISYQDFVFSGIHKESPLRKVKGQVFLGSEYFLAKMEQFMEQKEQLTEIPRKQLYATRPSLEKIFQTNDKREMKIYQANQKYGYTLKEIGQYLGLHYTTISKIIKKIEDRKK